MSVGKSGAFPMTCSTGAINSSTEADSVYIESSGGMTYRMWLIGKALQGVLGNSNITNRTGYSIENDTMYRAAEIAIANADAVIALLDKEGEK